MRIICRLVLYYFCQLSAISQHTPFRMSHSDNKHKFYMVKRATGYPYPMTLPMLLLLLGLYFIIFDLFLRQNDPLCGEVLQKKINKFLQS